jgi:hypothetical protein
MSRVSRHRPRAHPDWWLYAVAAGQFKADVEAGKSTCTSSSALESHAPRGGTRAGRAVGSPLVPHRRAVAFPVENADFGTACPYSATA